MPSPPTTNRASSSAHGSGLLSKLSFMRTSTPEQRSPRQENNDGTVDGRTDDSGLQTTPALATALREQQQPQRTRRRRGSLRKVALLGRGAQRERRESSRTIGVDTKLANSSRLASDGSIESGRDLTDSPMIDDQDGFGLGISDITPRPSMDGYASRSSAVNSAPMNAQTSFGTSAAPASTAAANSTQLPPITIPFPSTPGNGHHEIEPAVSSPTISYSTTDDEDSLHMGRSSGGAATDSILRPERASMSSGSDGYYPSRAGGALSSTSGSIQGIQSIQRRRSIQRAKSPLALTGLTTVGGGLVASTPLPLQPAGLDADWDYSETEWWGWVMLIVTWLVFVTGMGSCLGIWSWAWDVGTTPYAPPELEDDPTLPIVGYYPALIILSCVMAWVWVVAAWVGMKYFRHARVSGD